jgi:murein DD-endopeptidase MepM/ murein hydrolase activator NlpD
LGTQALSDAGFSREDQQQIRDDQSRYLVENPDLAAYFEYKNLVEADPQGFVEQTRLVNPGFDQYVRSSLTDHLTGEIDVSKAVYEDAFLAAHGVRPSIYSPLVGNEPSMAPGGYPALAGVPAGQPVLPPVAGTNPITIWPSPGDVFYGREGDEMVATVDPGTPLQTLSAPETRTTSRGEEYTVVKVGIGEWTGYVDASLVNSAAPPAPVSSEPVPQAGGGLADLAGNAVGALGAGKDALGSVVGSMLGAPGQESKPAETSLGVAPGSYDVVPASDGIGEQSTAAGSDRSWMEFMLDNDAYVSTEYKGPPTANMTYQVGHGATDGNHAAYDISCMSGNCSGKPVASPVTGKVVCSGYDQGTGESLAGCTYSKRTTWPGSAHTVVVEIGTTPDGQPIQLSFNHVGESTLQPGQTINIGDQLGTIGDTDGGPHIHVEGWIGDPQAGYLLVDPQLVVGGYYGPVTSVAGTYEYTPA